MGDTTFDTAIENMFDPGCQKSTELYEVAQKHPDQKKTSAMMVIEAHKQKTKVHEPDCFVNRSSG